MSNFSLVAKALSEACLAGAITVDAMEARCIKTFGQPYPWLRGLCKRVMKFREDDPSRWNSDHLVKLIKQDAGFNRAWRSQKRRPRIRFFFVSPKKMEVPPPALIDTGVPALPTIGELSNWLALSRGQLEWYASCWNDEKRRSTGPLHHYSYKWVPTSGDSPRLIEAPKDRLREIQKKILKKILNKIPPHPAAHGFVKGRSCLTFCSHHINKRVVLSMDLSFSRIFVGIERTN